MAEGKERYAIVRVDYNCPKDVFHEFNFCLLSKGKTLVDICDHCDFLAEKRIIGDTKEQLIRKVAQVFFKRKLKAYKKLLGGMPKDKKGLKEVEKRCLDCAKEIVEFLGVE